MDSSSTVLNGEVVAPSPQQSTQPQPIPPTVQSVPITDIEHPILLAKIQASEVIVADPLNGFTSEKLSEEQSSAAVATSAVESSPQVVASPPTAVAAPAVAPPPPPTEPIISFEQPQIPKVGPPPRPEHITIPEYVEDALNEVALQQGFTNYSVDLNYGANKGDGFVGDIIKAKITGDLTLNGKTKSDSELILIVKLPPENPIRRQAIGIKLFEREVLMYNEVLPTLMRFQEENGLRPGVAGFYSFPKCYKAYYNLAEDRSYVIMDDIRENGFQMESKFKPVEFGTAKKVVEKLAEFHGISFAMKQQKPNEFARFKELKDVMHSDEQAAKDMMAMMLSSAVQRAAAALEPHETVLKEKLIKVCEKMPYETDRYLGVNSEPYSVINHGDCWINNMMFKYESGLAKHICFLDWQCSRYSSPVLDLVYFIFLCTDSQLRARYFDDLIQAYHHSLRAQLERFNADVNELYPLTAMLRQLKQYGRFGLGVALIVVPMLCSEADELPDMDEVAKKFKDGGINESDSDIFKVTTKSQNKFNVRISGIVRDMNKRGFF